MEDGSAPSPGLGGRAQTPAPAARSVLRAVDPEAPPAEMRQQFDVAARVIEQLSARRMNVHFEVDHETGTVRVEVLNDEGAVVCEIPASSLLDTLSGGGLVVDQPGRRKLTLPPS